MPRSDGYKNLKPVTKRTKDEARSLSRKGGVASGKKRREEKEARECMKALFSYALAGFQDDTEKLLRDIGIAPSERNQRMALLTSMLLQGQKGNTKAAELAIKIAGEMPADKTEITGSNGAPLVPERRYDFSHYSPEEARPLIRELYAENFKT